MVPRRWGFCLLCLMLTVSAGRADERDFHLSTPTAQPDDAEAEGRFRIDQSRLDTPEWREAIRKAKSHQSGRGFYTLLRVIAEDANPKEPIQLQATKLKEFTEKYHGGGGEYLVGLSGDFVLFQHINSVHRRNQRDPVVLGSLAHGKSQLWAEVPSAGTLNVVGDVILRSCPDEEKGLLVLSLNAPADLESTPVVIGPVVVGGPYGKKHRVHAAQDLELRLPPGDYKLLLPDFDLKKSRWDVTIVAGEGKKVVFDIRDAEADEP